MVSICRQSIPAKFQTKYFLLLIKLQFFFFKRRRDFVSAIRKPFCTFSVNASHHFHVRFENNRKQFFLEKWKYSDVDFWQILEGNQNISCSRHECAKFLEAETSMMNFGSKSLRKYKVKSWKYKINSKMQAGWHLWPWRSARGEEVGQF